MINKVSLDVRTHHARASIDNGPYYIVSRDENMGEYLEALGVDPDEGILRDSTFVSTWTRDRELIKVEIFRTDGKYFLLELTYTDSSIEPITILKCGRKPEAALRHYVKDFAFHKIKGTVWTKPQNYELTCPTCGGDFDRIPLRVKCPYNYRVKCRGCQRKYEIVTERGKVEMRDD